MKWPKLLTNLFKPKEDSPPLPAPSVVRDVHDGRPNKGDKRTGVVTYKFTPEARRMVITLIAQCKTNREIMAAFLAETGMEIDKETVKKYRSSKKWKEVIQKEREEYLNSIADVPGYHERVRMERADKIYEGATLKHDDDLALRAIEHQRKEVKEKGHAPVNFILQQYNGMSDEELKDKYNQALIKVVEHNKRKQLKETTNGNGGNEVEAGK